MATKHVGATTDVDVGKNPDAGDEVVRSTARELRDLERERKRVEQRLIPDPDTRPRPEDGDQPTEQTPLDDRELARLPGGTPASAIARARAQRGYREGPAKDENKFGTWYGWNKVPWCAIFVSWVFYQDGVPLPASTPKGFASCSVGRDWFRKNRRLRPAGTRPKPGWIVFFDWNGGPGLDHVGIVIDVLADGRILTIEGNTSDPGSSSPNSVGVFEKRRRAGIVGYGVPEFRPSANIGDELPHLKQGAKGAHVRRLQGLIRAAFPGLKDGTLSLSGEFDSATVDYVRRFQTKHKLEVDGKVGPNTWRALLGLKQK
jgi:cell wall-associated NlpC family hydrolase